MKKKEKIKESISVPIEWLSKLVKHAEIAEKNKDHMQKQIHLIGFALSAKVLLKYGIKI